MFRGDKKASFAQKRTCSSQKYSEKNRTQDMVFGMEKWPVFSHGMVFGMDEKVLVCFLVCVPQPPWDTVKREVYIMLQFVWFASGKKRFVDSKM